MESLSLGFTGVIFFIVVGIKPSYVITCGTLNFENHTVMECQTARLIYTPNKEQAHEMRKWVRISRLNTKMIYDYKMSNDESKYFESKQGESYILSISAVNSADAANYLVICRGGHYTSRSKLDVSVNTNEICGKLSTRSSYVIEVIEGDPVTFQFYVDPGKDITWEKKVETTCTYTQLKDQKYIIGVLREKKVHTLYILETEYNNSGEYRVNCGDTVSNSIYLNIEYSPPSNPVFSNIVSRFYCNNKECILATLAKLVTVECYVVGGSKPIELNMLKDGVKLTKTNKTSKDINTKTYHYIKYSFIPTMPDRNAMFKCTVNNPAIQVPFSTSKMLYVAVPPHSVTVEELLKQNQENGDTMITLKFSVAGSNTRSSIAFSKFTGVQRQLVDKRTERENDTHGWTFTEIWSFNFTRDDNTKGIKCDVKNDEFPDLELSYIYKLNITYSPIVTISGHENVTFVGDDVRLTCHVESNPPSTISWYNQSGLIQAAYGTRTLDIQLSSVSTDDSGVYICTAHNGIGGVTVRTLSLFVKESTSAFADNNVLGLSVGISISAAVVLILVISVIMFYQKRKNVALVRTRKNRIEKDDNGDNGNTQGDTDRQAGYEYLDMQNSSKESKLYTPLDTEMQAGYESLAGQDTTTEIEMYTNLNTEMQAGYESLAGQGTTTEIEMYTHLEGPTSTELPSEYENSEL